MLVPIRVRLGHRADVIQALHLLCGQPPRGGGEVISKLLLVARAHQDRIHARPAHYPVESHLGRRYAAIEGNVARTSTIL